MLTGKPSYLRSAEPAAVPETVAPAENSETPAESKPEPTEAPAEEKPAAAPVEEKSPHFVSGPLSWVQENPGRQLLTGSFHPVSDNHWYDLTFSAHSSIEEFVQTLTGSAFDGGISQIRTVLRRNRNQVRVFGTASDLPF